MKKKNYTSPEIDLVLVTRDIITYSETEEWEGPVIQAGHENENE